MSATGTDSTAANGAGAAEAWLRSFEAGWREPDGPEGFAERFEAVLDPEVRLVQPQLPTLVGREAFRRGFVEPIFALIPDLCGEVERWSTTGDLLYIELALRGTLGGRPVGWTSCDRIALRDGLAVERVAYFDPAPLLRAVLTRPRAWPRFLRARLMLRRYLRERRRPAR